MIANKGKTNSYWFLKSRLENKKKMDDIRIERIKRGMDHKMKSYDRILTALLRHNKLIEDVKNAELPDLMDDTRGQLDSNIFGLFRFMIVAFIAVLFFGGLIYVMGLLNTSFIQVGVANEGNAGQPGYVNLSLAAAQTFGQVNSSIQALRLVALTLIFSEIILIFVFNSFKRVHPALFIPWILIVFLAVMFAAPISNAYATIVSAGTYGGLLESFTASNYILLNLPTIVLLVGVLGGIFMFVNIVRSGGETPL